MPKKAHLQVTTGLSGLDQVLSWFSQLHEPPISRSLWLRCSLALAEGFTNAVRHAHRYKPSDYPVDIGVTIFPERLEIRVWDEGESFNLEKRLEEVMDPVDLFAGGGRGLKLMKDIADVITYRPDGNGRNCLLILKYFD